jgi:branched-chain amino acid aminotransferase
MRAGFPKESPIRVYISVLSYLGQTPILGVKIGDHYKFVVIIGPVGAYYPEPVNVLIQEKYVRAFPGGTGAAKFSGNYSATLLPVKEAKEQGCNQILWDRWI